MKHAVCSAEVPVSQVEEQYYDILSSTSSKDQDFFPCKASQEITKTAVLTTKANQERTKELQMHTHTHPPVHVHQSSLISQLLFKESFLN